MFGRGLRTHLSLTALSISALLISILSPVSHAAAPALVTCVNLQTGTERISHTGTCRYTQEAQANWRKNQSDSPIASGASAKVITICSNKESSPVTYQVIRSKCAKHQVTTIFSRSGALPNKPVIAEAVSFGYDSASLKLATDPATTTDAPIAFYTITSSKGVTQRIYSWRDLTLAVTGLQAQTTYSFTVSATTADGSSQVSAFSNLVTTAAYVPPAPTPSSSAPTLAAPAFTLSSTAETKTVNNAITGYTITSTGGTIASYAISPAAPAGITFNTSTGLLSGTPTSTQSATTYTITATNVTGSATATFTLTVSSSTPSFTFSSNTETKVVTTALVGYTISSTGAAITSYSLVGTLPSGLNFSTSNGRITGTPTETRTATTYTIIGTSASGETATATYRLRVTGDIGDVGPGGGVIFYYLAAGFKCGPTRTANCKYLEAAPSGWSGVSDKRVTWAKLPYYDTVVNNPTSPETSTARAIGWGYRNTLAIINQGNTETTTSAASLAVSYTVTVNGDIYDDWFLPSRDELQQMYDNQSSIGGFVVGDPYWSSTEMASGTAYTYRFNTGGAVVSKNQSVVRVRPVRSF